MVFPHGWQDEFLTTSLHHGLSLSCVCHIFSSLFCTLARSHQKFVFLHLESNSLYPSQNGMQPDVSD